MKEKLLHAVCIRGPSDRNNVLVPAMGKPESQFVGLLRMAAVEEGFQRPSLAQSPMPAERLPRSPAAPPVSPLPGQQLGPGEQKSVALLKEHFLFELGLQLLEATQEQEAAKEEGMGGAAAAAGSRRRKSHLSSCGSRECPKTELAAQEQRICELETRPREAQTELGQRRNQTQQLEDEPKPGQRHQEDPCQQMEGLMPSWRSPCVEVQAVPQRGEEEPAELCGRLKSTQVEVEALWAELHDTHLLAEGAMVLLAMAETEATALKSKYRLALVEAAESSRALCSLQESHSVLQQGMAEREALLQRLESQAREQLANLRRAQEEEVGRQRELLGAEQHKSQVLGEELQKRGQELSTLREALQKAEEQQQQSEEQAEQRQAEVQATREQLSHCQEQLAQNGAALMEQRKAFQEMVGDRDRTITKLQGSLNTLEEEWAQAKDELARKEAEVSSLWAKMEEQRHATHPLQHEKEASLRQSPSTVALREWLQDKRGASQPAHQADREELRAKLLKLQQELDVCKDHNQENLSKLQAHECAMEKQSLDLDLLLHQCQTLKGQLFYYEELAQKQELALSHQHEREQQLQERLDQAESSADLLEDSLSLYKQKYQASLARGRELESRLQLLEEELASQAKAREEAILKHQAEQEAWQEELEGKCRQASCAEEAVERLARELHDAQQEQRQGRQLACQFEETIQGLREELSDSRTKLLDQEGELATLHREFASYKATHSLSNSSYEGQVLHAETLQQKLQEARVESAAHQQKAEEYQDLVQDLKLELVRVAEQKNSALKGLARLELTVESLQQEAAAERERQEVEVAVLRQQAQQLELELGQSRQSCARQQQADRKRDELLHKSHAKMVRACSALQEKGQALEQQRARVRHLETGLREAQQALESSRAECTVLRTEMEALQQSLQESQERHQKAAQELAQQNEQLLLAQNSLCAAQEQLEERVAEVVHHAQAARRLEAEAQVLNERVAAAEEELEQKRDLLEHLTEELIHSRQQHQEAAQEAQQQRQEVARLEQKLESSREGLRSLQQQVKGQESALERLRQQEEELQRQLHKAQQRETQLAHSHKEVQRQLQHSQCQALRQEATLSQLRTELHAIQERERQNHQAAQDLTAQAASCQASQREAVEKLEQKAREASCLQAELQLAQHKVAHLEEQVACTQEQLQELMAARREQEQEVESLQTSLEVARSDSHRLRHESELMMANVSQWVKEQKQANEKLSYKIRDQIKQMAQLMGERDHLHGLAERLEQENKRLKNEVDELLIECERLKALHSYDSDLCTARQRPALPVNNSPQLAPRRSKELATKWDLT